MTMSFDEGFYALQLLSQIFSPKNETREENCGKLNFGAYISIKKPQKGFWGPPTFIPLYIDLTWCQKKNCFHLKRPNSPSHVAQAGGLIVPSTFEHSLLCSQTFIRGLPRFSRRKNSLNVASASRTTTCRSRLLALSQNLTHLPTTFLCASTRQPKSYLPGILFGTPSPSVWHLCSSLKTT